MPVNWRFVLLGITSVVLSIASGWTTLDGMSNFTSAPILSLLITFGIQSVMLISAWMLGEAVVNRFHGTSTKHQTVQATLWIAAAVLAGLAVVAPLIISGLGHPTWTTLVAPWVIPALVGSAVLVALALVIKSRNSANPPRAMLNTAMLVAMFTTCMTTSVFFSFDSLFSKVFPDSERARASEIRAQSETASILSDLMTVAQKERSNERTHLIDGATWKDYASGLDSLRTQSANRVEALEADRVALTRLQNKDLEARARERAEATTLRDQAREKDAALRSDLERRKQQRAELQQSGLKIDEKLQHLRQQLLEANALAMEEERGLGESGRAGRGPIYDRLRAEVDRTQIDIQRQEAGREQLSTQANELTTQIQALEDEIVAQSVRLTSADSALTAATTTGSSSALGRNDNLIDELKTKLAGVETARADFERSMARQSLEALGQACRQSSDAINRSGGDVRISCGTADLDLDAAKIEARTTALAALSAQCSAAASKQATEDTTSVATLVSRTRDCVQIAGLPSSTTELLRRRLDNVERNRDDRAHRFIVTMNAFSDGNRLAYLALAIALGIDGLVFISGLLAAATRASPFRSLPGATGHTVAGADRIMRSALLPNPAEVARLALAMVLPVPPNMREDVSGFTHQINLGEIGLRNSPEVIHLINAAAGIGAARRVDSNPDMYLLRREVVDFLTLHMGDFETKQSSNQKPARAPNHVHNLRCNASPAALEAFLSYVRPAIGEGDFVFRIELDSVAENDRPAIIKILNASAIDGGARPAKDGANSYDIDRAIVAVMLDITRDPEQSSPPTSATTTRASSTASQATARQNSDRPEVPVTHEFDGVQASSKRASELVQANQNIVLDASVDDTVRPNTNALGALKRNGTESSQQDKPAPYKLPVPMAVTFRKPNLEAGIAAHNSTANEEKSQAADSMPKEVEAEPNGEVHINAGHEAPVKPKSATVVKRKTEDAEKPFNVKIIGDSMKFD